MTTKQVHMLSDRSVYIGIYGRFVRLSGQLGIAASAVEPVFSVLTSNPIDSLIEGVVRVGGAGVQLTFELALLCSASWRVSKAVKTGCPHCTRLATGAGCRTYAQAGFRAPTRPHGAA